MKILSHRGYWKHKAEKNSEHAFRRSFSLGFGTETDIRDCGGQLMISHDPPNGGEMHFSRFLEIYSEYLGDLPLALNIKSDGLPSMLVKCLEPYSADCFFFDMSVPDALGYLKAGLPVLTRVSEYETVPSYYEDAFGVWVDSFYGDWYDEDVLEGFLSDGKSVCIVSPELHGRDDLGLWKRLLTMDCCRESAVLLCTDFPEVAADFLGKV